jgi:hypothetical protein
MKRKVAWRGWTRGRCCRLVAYVVLGLAALDVTIGWFDATWACYDPNEYRERLEHCRGQAWDLVLIGGSPMAEGMDPAHLSGLSWHGTPLARVFNLGLAGATTSTVWHALEHSVVTPPRLLVYGITATDLNDSRDEPNGVWTLMDVADVAEWLQRRPAQGAWCLRQFACERLARLWKLRYHRNAIRLWAADHLERWRPGTCSETAAAARNELRFSAALRRGDGFAPRPDYDDHCLADLQVMKLLQPRFHFLENYRLGGHLQYLHRILDWAAEHGVAVVLVDMPVAAEVEAMHPQAFAAYRAALAEVERTRGVRVLRPTRETLGLDDTLFADRMHLNARGRGRLGPWVRSRLADLGAVGVAGIPDRK